MVETSRRWPRSWERGELRSFGGSSATASTSSRSEPDPSLAGCADTDRVTTVTGVAPPTPSLAPGDPQPGSGDRPGGTRAAHVSAPRGLSLLPEECANESHVGRGFR